MLANNLSSRTPTDIERTLNAAGITDPKQRAAYLKQELQKQTTHAPAASQSVQLNTEKDFLGKIGEEAGKEVIAGSGAAKGALNTVESTNDIRNALIAAR